MRQHVNELARKDYSKYIKGLHVLAVYGGASIEPQIRALKKGVQVIVATPGRLVDLMERGVAKLDQVENVVLDEADEMLSMGFSESIDTILEKIPAERNTLLFSATMSKEIERIRTPKGSKPVPSLHRGRHGASAGRMRMPRRGFRRFGPIFVPRLHAERIEWH